MAQQFLHDAQIGPTLEQVCGRAVPQTVRSHVRGAIDGGDCLVHHGASLSHVEPPAPRPQQQGRPGFRGNQGRAPVGQPGSQRIGGRFPQRHAVHAEAALGDLVFLHVEERGVVAGPCERSDARRGSGHEAGEQGGELAERRVTFEP